MSKCASHGSRQKEGWSCTMHGLIGGGPRTGGRKLGWVYGFYSLQFMGTWFSLCDTNSRTTVSTGRGTIFVFAVWYNIFVISLHPPLRVNTARITTSNKISSFSVLYLVTRNQNLIRGNTILCLKNFVLSISRPRALSRVQNISVECRIFPRFPPPPPSLLLDKVKNVFSKWNTDVVTFVVEPLW